MNMGRGTRRAQRARGLRFKRACALLVLGAGAALIHAAAGAAAPSVHELAQRVDRHYDELHSLKAAFTEHYEGLGMERSESGILYLRKPGSMLWQYTSPPGKIFLLDGRYAWFYAKGDAQVQRIPAKELDDLRSPLRFLLGHTQLEKELTNLRVSPASDGLFTLSGVPAGRQNRITRISLTVTAAGAIRGIEVVEGDGAVTQFAFTDEQADVAIPPDLFRFTPPPGVPVVKAMPPV